MLESKSCRFSFHTHVQHVHSCRLKASRHTSHSCNRKARLSLHCVTNRSLPFLFETVVTKTAWVLYDQSHCEALARYLFSGLQAEKCSKFGHLLHFRQRAMNAQGAGDRSDALGGLGAAVTAPRKRSCRSAIRGNQRQSPDRAPPTAAMPRGSPGADLQRPRARAPGRHGRLV